jgi:hypothetical protein
MGISNCNGFLNLKETPDKLLTAIIV